MGWRPSLRIMCEGLTTSRCVCVCVCGYVCVCANCRSVGDDFYAFLYQYYYVILVVVVVVVSSIVYIYKRNVLLYECF